MEKSAKWKSAAAVVLIVLGCVVVTVAVPVIWLNRIVLDTDKYVETVQPLAEDPAVKDAAAARITDQLFSFINAEQLAKEVLPDRADFLAAPIVGVTKSFTQEEIRKGLDTQQFAKLWNEMNRRAHEAVKKLLLGQGEFVSAREGQVSLDLGAVIDDAKSRLAAHGINIFDKVDLSRLDTTLPLFESKELARAQAAVERLNSMALWLPIIALVLLAGAIAASLSRMTAVLWIGLGISIGMVALLVGISYGRGYYLEHAVAGGNVDYPVANAYLKLFVESLQTSIKRVFEGGLIIAVVGFALSPYSWPTRARKWTWEVFGKGMEKGATVDLGPAGRWVSAQKNILRVAGVVVALLLLIVMDQPTVSSALVIAAGLLLYLGAVEFTARKAA